jgi:hypothetical protein
MKKLLSLAVMVCMVAQSVAQTVTVSAAKLKDGNKPANGIIYWKPVTDDGTPASYRDPSGGIQTVSPMSAPVKNGAFSLALPDTTLTSPPNMCFAVDLVTANGSVLGAGYTCLQPHATALGANDWCQAGVCNLDNYTPSLPALPLFYGSPDMQTMWNQMVSQNIAAGNSITPQTLTDAAVVTFNATNPTLNVATLPLYDATNNVLDGVTSRTINMTGLVSGARFGILIKPLAKADVHQAQTVIFGNGCTWQFAPGDVLLSGNTLNIPEWASWSYFAVFIYDGTNCIGTVVD